MSQGMASAKPGNASEQQVRLQLQGLQHEVERSATIVRWLGWLALLLVILLIFLMIAIHLYSVMQYASVKNVRGGRRRGTARRGRDHLRARFRG